MPSCCGPATSCAPTATSRDATWAELAGRFDTKQLVELPMLVGHYVMVAGMLKSLRVQRDPGVEGFPTAPVTSADGPDSPAPR